MFRALRPATLVTAGWMAVVWVTRIRNALDDPELSAAATRGAVTVSVAALLGAAVLVVVGVRGGPRRAARVVAVAHGALWVWRGAAIALADHEVAFVVVHEVLALVSIALSVWVWVAAAPQVDDDRFRGEPTAPLRSAPLWDSPSR